MESYILSKKQIMKICDMKNVHLNPHTRTWLVIEGTDARIVSDDDNTIEITLAEAFTL